MRRVVASELMDDPAVDRAELASNFDDIEFANRYFGGIGPLDRLVRRSRARRLLDVGCGSGDVVRALLSRSLRRKRPLAAVALDGSETVLSIARERSGPQDALHFVNGDARALPFPDRAFDLATLNLALHHFEPPDATVVLRELRRVANVPVVCDLERSPPAYWAAALFASLIAKNRLTKHDAPLSVERAYTPREAEALARSAGWRRPHARRLPFFRFLLVDRG